MPIAITDVQLALADAVRDWASRTEPVNTVRAAECAALPSPPPGWTSLAGLGLFGIAVPEEAGGADSSVADAATGVEAAAAALAPGPVTSTVLAALLLSRAADGAPASTTNPRQAGTFLLPTGDDLLAGRAHAAICTGSSPGVEATAMADGGLRVTGDAGLVADADDGAHLLLSAGGRWFVLPPGTPGVELKSADPLDFSRALATVRLTDVHVPPASLLGGLTDDDVANLTATLVAAEASGVADWCLRTASEYARVREQFGHKIGTFQAVKHRCAEMLCRAELAAALAWDAARAAEDGGEQFGIAAATAAAGAMDAAVDNAKDCIQVLGGIGFTWEHDAHLYLRRAVSLRQLAGGSARWRSRVAELARAGVRRSVGVEDVADASDEVRATAERLSRLPAAEQRIELADSGYLMPHWPPPYGLGASPAEQLAIDAELDRAGVERPNLVIGAWAAPTILRHGTDEQRTRFVGRTVRGEITWCQLFSEPEAGSDLAGLRTKAVRVDGGWRLTGQKVWTSLADRADWAICLARTDPQAPKHKGITYFLVDMRSAGIEIRPLREITGEARFNEVFLTDVFVPDADVVGEVDGGWRLARTTLANERVAMTSGSSLGAGLERLVKAHDVPDDQLGALVTEAAACAVLDVRSVYRQLAGRPGAESSVRKLLGVRNRQAVAELALDVLGPAGADAGGADDVQHEFLLSRCLSIAGGTTEVLLNVAAERILSLPR